MELPRAKIIPHNLCVLRLSNVSVQSMVLFSIFMHLLYCVYHLSC